MRKKVLLSLVMIITVLCLAVNIAYADDVASTSESIPTNVIDLGGNTKDTLNIGTTTTTTTTQSTIDLGTTTTTQATTNTVKTTASTVTTLPHTGATETSGVLVTIALLAVVGLVSFKVIKNNSDIK